MNAVARFIETLEGSITFLNESPFNEHYPVMPSVEEVQARIANVLRLSVEWLANDATLHNGHDCFIEQYYKGTTLARLVDYNWGDDVVLFQPQFIVSRLREDVYTTGSEIDRNKIDFYMQQCYQLNSYIIDKLNQVRAWANSTDQPRGKLPSASQEPATGRDLPSELDTEQARRYFARAVAAGLISEQYNWLASQALLACFCREMSVKLDLGKGYNSDGQKRLRWKPFGELFGVEPKNLTTSLNDIKKTGQNPIGIEKVEAIFND